MEQSVPLRVVILNESEDILVASGMRFAQEGFETVTRHSPHFREGELAFEQFIEQQDPQVIL